MSEPTDHLVEADERPWEEPGSCRMDCAPHRGLLLLVLGTVSMVSAFLSIFVLPGLIGLVVGYAACSMAQNDLEKMKDGLLDPNGKGQTERAAALGFLGGLFSIFCSIIGFVFVLPLCRAFCRCL